MWCPFSPSLHILLIFELIPLHSCACSFQILKIHQFLRTLMAIQCCPLLINGFPFSFIRQHIKYGRKINKYSKISFCHFIVSYSLQNTNLVTLVSLLKRKNSSRKWYWQLWTLLVVSFQCISFSTYNVNYGSTVFHSFHRSIKSETAK